MKSGIITAATSALLFSGAGNAAEIKVLSTQATEQTYRELVPQFEQASGHKVTTIFTGTLDANKRLAAGETYDLLIMSSASIDEHIKGGKVVPGSRVDLAKSGVAVAVRAGAPKPDISSAEAVKRAVLAAKSVGISTGPSGVYLSALFERMGITDQVKPKLKVPPSGAQIAELVAKGDIELGFQQVSEIVHVKGAELVGPLPPEIQRITVFSGAVHALSQEPDAARELLEFLASSEHAPLLQRHGLEPGASPPY